MMQNPEMLVFEAMCERYRPSEGAAQFTSFDGIHVDKTKALMLAETCPGDYRFHRSRWPAASQRMRIVESGRRIVKVEPTPTALATLI
jgi:hypothetical protein